MTKSKVKHHSDNFTTMQLYLVVLFKTFSLITESLCVWPSQVYGILTQCRCEKEDTVIVGIYRICSKVHSRLVNMMNELLKGNLLSLEKTLTTLLQKHYGR